MDLRCRIRSNYVCTNKKINFVADFDGDNFIGSSDIEHTVKLLTQNELNHEEIESVWEKVNFFESVYMYWQKQQTGAIFGPPGACVIKQITAVIKFQGNLLITAVIFFSMLSKTLKKY